MIIVGSDVGTSIIGIPSCIFITRIDTGRTCGQIIIPAADKRRIEENVIIIIAGITVEIGGGYGAETCRDSASQITSFVIK